MNKLLPYWILILTSLLVGAEVGKLDPKSAKRTKCLNPEYVVPAERSQRMIAAIQKAGGKQAKLKIYPDEGHGVRRLVYTDPGFYEWLFAQSLKH